jgi:hypothetical protein
LRVDVAILGDCVREDLNRRAPRAMAVMDPLKLVQVSDGFLAWRAAGVLDGDQA